MRNGEGTAVTLTVLDRMDCCTHETHVEFGGIMIERKYMDVKALVLTGIGEASRADGELSKMKAGRKERSPCDGRRDLQRATFRSTSDHLRSGW